MFIMDFLLGWLLYDKVAALLSSSKVMMPQCSELLIDDNRGIVVVRSALEQLIIVGCMHC